MDASWGFMFATKEQSGGLRSLETASGCSAVAYSELGTFDCTKLHVPEPGPSGCMKLQVSEPGTRCCKSSVPTAGFGASLIYAISSR